MTLIYRCDMCGDAEFGEDIPGWHTDVEDCLPDNWGLCRRPDFLETLCGGCYPRRSR